MSYTDRSNDADWKNGMPRHRWLGFLQATSSVGVIAGLAVAASAGLPYANIPLDPRIPTVVGQGAPLVFGAGMAAIMSSLAGLWWTHSRIKTPLNRLHLAVDEAVVDGFERRLDVPQTGIGAVLSNAVDRLQDTVVSITAADLSDGEDRMRMVFRKDAASKFQGILAALSNAHEVILEQGQERAAKQDSVFERTSQAAKALEKTVSLYQSEHGELSTIVKVSKDALRAIHSQLMRLKQVDPASVNAVIEQLDMQATSIASLIEANQRAFGDAGNASESLRRASDDLSASFLQVKSELQQTAQDSRAETQQANASLFDAIDELTGKLQVIEESLGASAAEVASTSQNLREHSAALQQDQQRNQAAFSSALGAFSDQYQGLIRSATADLKGAISASHVELAKAARDSSEKTNASLASLDKAVRQELEEIQTAASRFDTSLTRTLRDSQSGVEASMSWLDRSITELIGRNQSAVETSLSSLDNSISKSLQQNRDAIDGAVGAMTDEVTKDLSARREETTGAIIELVNKMRDQVAHGQGSLAEAVFNMECLSDAVGAAEARLEAAATAASNVFEQTADETRSSLSGLTRKTADELEASVANARDKMSAAADSIGEVAAAAVHDELQTVREASDHHAAFLRETTAQMRAEADRLGEAQQASDIVRSIASTTEQQLRAVSQTVETKSEAAVQAFERAAHDVERRSSGIVDRLDTVKARADKSSEVLGSSIEPLVSLLARARSTLDTIASVEESQLAPSLRRIQSSLRGISIYLEESGDEQLSQLTDTIRNEMRRTADGVTGPIDQLGSTLGEQRQKLEEIEAALLRSPDGGAQVSPELLREIGELCADQIAAANARSQGIEQSINTHFDLLGKAVNELREQTPQQIEKAVETLSARLEQQTSVREPGVKTALSALQSSIEKRLSALQDTSSAISQQTLQIDETVLEAVADKATQAGIGKLAEEVRGQLQAIAKDLNSAKTDAPAAASEDQSADDDPDHDHPANAPLGRQISVIEGLIGAVEAQAIELAKVATESPDLIKEMPGATEALESAEAALSAWTRQLDNLSTAVAIAKDAAFAPKQAA
ncbi:MAG: hypothetical protein AAF251_08365 [Pseudomonadota bacterium]